MEEILKKYGISKQLFLKVTQFIKLQVDQKIVYTLTDQEQIAAEILIMASEGMNVKTGEKQCNLPVVNKRFWGGFGKIKTEVKYCTLADPRINFGVNGLLEQVGFNARWYEHRLFISGKPIFRYKSKKKHNITVKRFLGMCWVNVC